MKTTHMYKRPTIRPSGIKINTSTEGETIEMKIERIVNNKEPIKDGAPILYTERKEGVKASTNIRTDRFEVAIDATDKIQKSYKARREEKAKKSAESNPPKGNEAEPTQGKGDKQPTDKNP